MINVTRDLLRKNIAGALRAAQDSATLSEGLPEKQAADIEYLIGQLIIDHIEIALSDHTK